jgi:pectate lyase C
MPTGVAGAGAGTVTAGSVAAAAGSSTSSGAAGSAVAGRGSSGASAGAGAGGVPAAAGGRAGTTAGSGSAGSAGSAGSVAGSSGAAGDAAAAGAGGGGGRAAAGSGGAAAGSGGTAAGSGGSPASGGTLNETIVVKSGETFDGKGKRYSAGSALGDGSQDEDQKPLFKLEDGATLVNVVLGSPAADGIHCHGDVTLRNIVWEDIGEDALTIKEPGTVTLDGGSAANGDDKVFQINAESTFKVSNFKASNAGKFIRQNGGTKFKISVVIDKCDISKMDEAIFRTDSDVSTVEMTNTRYSMIGDELFMGVAPANIKTSNNTEY